MRWAVRVEHFEVLEMHAKLWSENLKVRNHLGNLGQMEALYCHVK